MSSRKDVTIMIEAKHLRNPNVCTRQDKDLNYFRTQVKIAKDGFDLCPDTSQNRKRWIIYVRSWIPQRTKYGLFKVKSAKDGFDFCPYTNQKRKRWI